MYRVIVIFYLVGPVYNTLLLSMVWPDAMTSPLSRYSDTDACIRMVTRQRGLGRGHTQNAFGMYRIEIRETRKVEK